MLPPNHPLLVHPQSLRVVAAGAAIVFLVVVLSTFLVVRYLSDSSALRNVLQNSYETRLRVQSITALLDRAEAIRAVTDAAADPFAAERYRDTIRAADREMSRIEEAVRQSGQGQPQILDSVKAIRGRLGAFDERTQAADAASGSEATLRRERMRRYASVIDELRAGIDNLNLLQAQVIEAQAAEDKRRAYWSQVLVIMILSAIMLTVATAATLAILLLPGRDDGYPGFRR